MVAGVGKERGWVAKASEPEQTGDGTPPAVDWRPNGIIAGGPRTTVSYLRRFSALLLDWLLCELAAGVLVRSLVRSPWAVPLVFVIEYAFFIGLFAQTPGMFVARIRCVSVANGGRIGVPRAFLRGLLVVTLLPALLGWHDRAAGSIIEPAERRS